MILLLVINIYCLYVWYDLAENRELKHKVELMKQQNELTHQYYEDMEIIIIVPEESYMISEII